jgi:phosphoribosylamine--glycine ligase
MHMRVLVVGGGGREHAIAWKLSQSPRVTELLAAPGNAGTAQIAENVAVSAEDVDTLLRLAQERAVDLTVVGPEVSLAAGIADRFAEAGLLLFGPTQAAARIETSKAFAKDLMLRHGVPTANAAVFDDYDDARRYVEGTPAPVVIKADGLAAGKGVVVARTKEDALEALRLQMVERQFGAAGDRVLVEECLEGEEISVFAFVDGRNVSSLVAACDYKRQGDGDSGPNTGGVGAYSPPPSHLWNDDIDREVRDRIIEPVVRALSEEGAPYVGALYAGLMHTGTGPQVIEFNCRLGDPETQVLLPRLKTDLADVMIAAARGDLSDVELAWDPRPCVGVVLSSGGYPGAYETGFEIDGLDVEQADTVLFHAGTRLDGASGRVVTDGGRVLMAVGLAPTLGEARKVAYDRAAAVGFEQAFWRTDIALPRRHGAPLH